MPTTRPRTLHLGGLQLSMTVERTLAEKVKSTPAYRWLRHAPAPLAFDDGVPALNGTQLQDITWYHTIDLGGGVVTPGFVDHRDQVGLYGIPASLAGKRCLDVATYDGFWAFEMEKRGAAEVIGIDVYSRADCDFPSNFRQEYLQASPNEPKGRGFAYAKRALRSRVRRKVLSVYELSPRLIGTFDFVFMSDILLHLRDPLRALEALWSVTAGDAVIADAYDRELEDSGLQGASRFSMAAAEGALDDFSGCLWWNPSTSVLKAMIQVARFQEVKELARLDLDTTAGIKVPKVIFSAKAGK
jgi:tRNA (mo5U34)-methyltransferase